jgi:hypothetical protein
VSSEIPEDLRVFIRKYFNSISLLDVVFLLKKDPHKKWTPATVSVEMRTNHSYADSQLRELTAMKFVGHEEPDVFWYEPQTQPELLEQLEQLYNSRRATVINFIYSQPIDSIRNFADAFKIKKD